MRLRLALLLIGVWIALTVGSGFVATASFRTVDRILAPGYRAELELRLPPRTPAEERPILRYLAAELNRRVFAAVAWSQVGLALALLLLVLSDGAARRAARALAVASALVALGLSLVVTPQIQKRGPPLDFVARPFPPEWAEAADGFFRLHGIFLGLDLLKLLLLLALAVLLVRRREPSWMGDRGPGARAPSRLAARRRRLTAAGPSPNFVGPP